MSSMIFHHIKLTHFRKSTVMGCMRQELQCIEHQIQFSINLR